MAVRLQAYGSLLTDRFPAFSFDESPKDLTYIAVPEATRMNRWAVFFRIILLIPANVVAGVVGSGMAIVMVVIWVWTLITGWLPRPVHEAASASLRYTTRYAAYAVPPCPDIPPRIVR